MPSKDFLRWFSLVALVLQTTSLVLLLRYSRTKNVEPYISSTAIVIAELIKGCICIVFVWIENDFSLNRLHQAIDTEILKKPRETLQLAIPSGIYAIQSNLLFVALTYINAATYQVTYQLKILTTALFSILMMKKVIVAHQWIALVLLTVGVGFVSWPSSDEIKKRSLTQTNTTFFQQTIGFLAVLTSTVTSGYAGVKFEKILKTGTTSVWVRNIQLAIFGVIFGTLIVLIFDHEAVFKNGFFQGYTPLVWLVVVLQAIGGLIVASVIKFADNIIKGFATSISIISSSVISYYLLNDFIPTTLFYVGATLVIMATFLYSHEASTPALVTNTEQPKV